MKEHRFLSAQEAGTFLRQQLEGDLKGQIALRDHAVLILPGGNSIKLFFPYLISLDVPWDKITIGLSDERCVPLDHEMSNEKQLKECFLDLLPNYNYCSLNQELIAKIQEFPPITVLSMGIDGHVASLFPEEYEDWKDKGIGIYKTKTQSPNRDSLSEKSLAHSKMIYISVVGENKNIFLDNVKNFLYCLNSIYEKSCLIRI
jgi:6-phosphogluconolactonase